jgi:hypothetical protein
MNKDDIILRLQQQKQRQEQELNEHIVNLENTIASIHAIEGKEIAPPNFPPQNPFEGVPIPRIDTNTYLNIARRLVDNKNKVRTPGVRGQPLIKELNLRIREVEEIIIRFDNSTEQIIGSRDTRLRGNLQQIQDDRDKLRIELEFYRDLAEAIQTEPKRLSKEELGEEKYKAKDWWKRRNPGK